MLKSALVERQFAAWFKAAVQVSAGRPAKDTTMSCTVTQKWCSQFLCYKGATTGCRGGGIRTPIRCIIQKKKERINSFCYYCRYYPLLCLVYDLKFGNAKRFLYIKFVLLFCILSVRRANVITSLIYLWAVPYSNFESLMTLFSLFSSMRGRPPSGPNARPRF